ncbi:hypothetical protein [Vannielia litorea]|uniref:Uncharacterized protein n=1 Tax=Vannielia litorea TaxID=1217970 RepID=A0A1N6F810_9RHOB|nr:hypothetical protein [Vannielia litorea]SIN91415.1 hypothetical protein SAMN05444002_1455 [Vannielia litorea]
MRHLALPSALALLASPLGAQSDDEPIAMCSSASYEVWVTAQDDPARPALLTLIGARPQSARLTRRNGLRLFASSTADKLYLALHLLPDGTTRIMVQPMGGESVLEEADCSSREALVSYLEART